MAKVLKNIFSGSDEILQGRTVQSWHVSQSVDAFTGASDYDITISGSLTIIGPVSSSGGFTGSLLGTSSWANNAVTSSYILQAVSSSFASTASFVQNAQTASYVLNAVSSSFASTASFVNPLNQSVILTGSLSTTGSVTLQGLTIVPKPFVVTIDSSTGQLFYTSSTGFIGSAGQPQGPSGSYQFNNSPGFSGSSDLTYIGGLLRATGSFSGSFTGRYNNLVSTGNTTVGEFQMVYASGSGTTATISSSQLVVVNPSTGRITSNRLQVDGAGTTSIGSGVGQIYLNGATNNLIEFNTNGFYPPTFVTRSIGTKTVLYPGMSSTQTDYAIGIELYTMWYSVPTSSYSGIPTNFKWYAGTTNIATLTGTGALVIGNISPSTTSGWIYASGDVVAFATSDKRLKDNIAPISNPIEKIQKIGGYEFDWIPTEEAHSYKGHDIGVIAQEIEEVLPELVQTRDNGYKAVKYDKIVALLIEAIKDQQKQIDELKSKIK